jgi:hypothetical protein
MFKVKRDFTYFFLDKQSVQKKNNQQACKTFSRVTHKISKANFDDESFIKFLFETS